MFVCAECVGGPKFSNSDAFLAHFNFYHSKLISAGQMTCTHTNCIRRKFSKYNSFRKHVKNVHKSEEGVSHADCGNNGIGENICDGSMETSQTSTSDLSVGMEVSSETSTSSNATDHLSNIVNCYDSSRKEISSVSFDESLSKAVLSYIGCLYDCSTFTETQIQYIIESHMQLLGGGFLLILKDFVLNLLSRGKLENLVSNSEIKNVTRMFDSCQNLFQGFETEYLRTKETEGSGAYVPPEPYIIGPATTSKREQGHTVVDPISLTGQFVPFRNNLKGFLELPDVLKKTMDYVSYLETSFSTSGLLENIIQGELWRNTIKPKFADKYVLPLVFNFDDFESNKELGTHTGVHKLGAGYIYIACLPPQFMSALENKFSVLLFHSGDRAFGNQKVFRKVISELKYLEEEGITVVTPDGVFQLYFALTLVIGDNLGANGVLGFVESFQANFYCRICFESSDVMATQTESNPLKRRTPERYAQDLLVNNESLTGRKGECVFDEVESFKSTENVHVDIMHDLDEGVWKYLMYLIVKYLYDKKRFTVNYFNEIIQNFFYGSNEEKNRLPSVSKDDLCKSKRLRFSASEMSFFVRYFGLMFGHLIKPEDRHVWNLYLHARNIVDIVTSPVVCESDAISLKHLIKELNSGFIKVFKINLKPKFHFMTHEPDLIPLLGPLDPLSCYRTEHKHKEGKDVAHNSHNRINLPFTILKRSQLKFAYRLLAHRGFRDKFEYSVVKKVQVENIKNYDLFCDSLPLNHNREWNTVKWLQVNGARYEIGSVVLIALDGNLPVFGQINVISICNANQAFFVVKHFNVVKFEKHVHAYEVTEEETWSFVDSKKLRTHVPSEVRRVTNGKYYISFRFSVACLNGTHP